MDNLSTDCVAYTVPKNEADVFRFCWLYRSILPEFIPDIKGLIKVEAAKHITAAEPPSFGAPRTKPTTVPRTSTFALLPASADASQPA